MKVNALEAPPPGAGLTTVTVAKPAAVMSAASMSASSQTGQSIGQTPGPLMTLGRGEPFQVIVDPSTKLRPHSESKTRSLKPGDPAGTALGESVIAVEGGLMTVTVQLVSEPPSSLGTRARIVTGTPVARLVSTPKPAELPKGDGYAFGCTSTAAGSELSRSSVKSPG